MSNLYYPIKKLCYNFIKYIYQTKVRNKDIELLNLCAIVEPVRYYQSIYEYYKNININMIHQI